MPTFMLEGNKAKFIIENSWNLDKMLKFSLNFGIFDVTAESGPFLQTEAWRRILNNFPEIIEWQIEIRKRDNDPHEVDELAVYVCAKDSSDRRQLEVDIRSKILLSTEVSPNTIAFCSLPEIVKRLELETASKEKRILDSREKN